MTDNQLPKDLDYVIARYLEQLERGESPDHEQLLREHPHLADSLRGFFINHDQMQAAVGGAPQDELTMPPSAGTAAEDATICPAADVGEGPEDATIPPGQSSEHTATIPPSASEQSPAIGTSVRYFGDYELVEEIARGGMGVVYKARQVNLNRIVALKMILAGQLAGEEDVQRFHAEAEAAANLEHPGIVPIFEIGEHEGQHYFSMGFVEGESLADKIKDGSLPPIKAAQYVQKIAEAMAFAHDRGVIHRDLKPANVLVDRNDQPKVTDFGLAKKTQADSGLTATGQVLGTPSYMPPEQAAGKIDDITESADVYSLGAILYALLTGRPPFQAASTMDTLLQVLEREPTAPRQLDPSIPRDVETICLKCLAKQSPRRYANSTELQADLARWLSGEPIQARRVTRLEKAWLWCRRRPAIAGLAIAMLILVTISGIVFELQRRTNLHKRVEAALQTLENAAPAAVPQAIRGLEQLPRSRVLPSLKQRFSPGRGWGSGNLELAMALAAYGEGDEPRTLHVLISAIEEAPQGALDNIVCALDVKPEESLNQIRARFGFIEVHQNKVVGGWEKVPYIRKGRLTSVALHLGDMAFAANVHAIDRCDPTEQTVFIHDVFPSWHGDLSRLVKKLWKSSMNWPHGVEQQPWASGICLALGKLNSKEFGPDREAVETFLNACYRSRQSGNHSAALWALKRWKSPIEVVYDLGENWQGTSHGFTLIRVPAGEFDRTSNDGKTKQHVTLTRDVWVSDIEVTDALFQQFIDDPAYPSEQKPPDWKGVAHSASPSDEHPVEQVSWEDAILFCNWLSSVSRMDPYYKVEFRDSPREIEGYLSSVEPTDTNGYRLLTEAEWEYACRAGSTTDYYFGDDHEQLSDYAVFGRRSGRARSKMCNRWGLFDLHGNAREWCYDRYGKYGESAASDPSGPHLGSSRVVRGGGWDSIAEEFTSGNRRSSDPTRRDRSTGFRVARWGKHAEPRAAAGKSTPRRRGPEQGDLRAESTERSP